MWKRLTHPNIVPLLAITSTPPQLISEWVPGGDLPDYIKVHPGADLRELVGAPPGTFTPHLPRHQLSDVAEGLRYLHSCNVVHRDLKGVGFRP